MLIYGYKNLITNKWYIGKTQAQEGKRYRTHIDNVAKGKHSKFYNSVRKHGWNNFKYNVLYRETNKDKLKLLERRTIRKYDSYRNGYNATKGGDGGDTWSGLTSERRLERSQ